MYDLLRTVATTLLKENAEHVTTRDIWSEGMKFTHHTIQTDDEIVDLIYDDQDRLDKIQILVGKQ